MREGQRGEIDAKWRASSPMVKPILVCPVEDDCRPSLEVSTQAKLVFPPHLSLPP
jgi:hypothetical protein